MNKLQAKCKHGEVKKYQKTLPGQGGPRGAFNIWKCSDCFLEFRPVEEVDGQKPLGAHGEDATVHGTQDQAGPGA